jgi:hypothetical protein
LKKGCLIALGIPVAFVLGIITLFWANYYDVHVRYRLTVEVQDGNQIKTGSSVIDASYEIDPDWIWEGPNTHLSKIVGYAPTVDLGERGMLFLTFSNTSRTPDGIRESNRQFFCAMDDIWCLPFAAYGGQGKGVDGHHSARKAILNELLRQKGPREVPFVLLPEFKTYRDIDGRPRYLNPRPEDLAATFGPGVELKRVILELTDDPVTPMPDIWPQWLKTNFEIEGIGYRR